MDNLTCDIEKIVRYKGSHKSGGFYLQIKKKGSGYHTFTEEVAILGEHWHD